MKTVIKRDGVEKEFDSSKIKRVIKLANNSVVKEARLSEEEIDEIVESVVFDLKDEETIEIERIQDLVEKELSAVNFIVGKAFILKREERRNNRFLRDETVKMMEAKYSGKGWDKQNANVDGLSFEGKAGEAHAVYDKEFALNYMISEKFAKNHRDGYVYIHDLSDYKKGKHNCLTFPEDDCRDNGMTIKLPKDIRKSGSVGTESQLIMVRLQSQSMPQFGGVSISHLDFTLAPLVKKDYYKFYKKNYERIVGKPLDATFGPQLSIDNSDYIVYNTQVAKFAMEDLEEEVHQAMEGLLHNANTLQSRSGNQLPFTSVNYGLDTSADGRLVTKHLLSSWEEGIGELGLSPIFPCGIFQYKKGINDKPGTPNYDLKQQAISVLPKRDYPNFANCDWSVQREAFEKSQSIKEKVLKSLSKEDLEELSKLSPEMLKTLGFQIIDDGKEETTIE